jgi:hypothetical protein
MVKIENVVLMENMSARGFYPRALFYELQFYEICVYSEIRQTPCAGRSERHTVQGGEYEFSKAKLVPDGNLYASSER